MIVLFGLSMFFSGIITYLIFKGLQFYYHTMVRYEDPLARFRLFINNIGDINFFLLLFIPLSIFFSLSLLSPTLPISKRFQKEFIISLVVTLNIEFKSYQMMNLEILRKILIWQVKNWNKP